MRIELNSNVGKNKELNRLLDTANKFFQNALTYAEEPNVWMDGENGKNISQAEMIQAEFSWAMEQIEMAKLLILDRAKQKRHINNPSY